MHKGHCLRWCIFWMQSKQLDDYHFTLLERERVAADHTNPRDFQLDWCSTTAGPYWIVSQTYVKRGDNKRVVFVMRPCRKQVVKLYNNADKLKTISTSILIEANMEMIQLFFRKFLLHLIKKNQAGSDITSLSGDCITTCAHPHIYNHHLKDLK